MEEERLILIKEHKQMQEQSDTTEGEKHEI